MTMTTKERRLAITEIEIPQHALVTCSCYISKFVAFCLWHFGWQGKVTEGATFIYDVLVCCSE